jgi:hypothetical protein
MNEYAESYDSARLLHLSQAYISLSIATWCFIHAVQKAVQVFAACFGMCTSFDVHVGDTVQRAVVAAR